MQTATLRALDALAKATGATSDYRLSITLGISRQRISMYRTGHRRLDDDIAVRVAELAGIPPGQLLAELAGERSESDVARTHWQRLAELAAPARAAVVAVAILAATGMYAEPRLGLDSVAEAASLSQADCASAHIQCVQLAIPAGSYWPLILLVLLGALTPPVRRPQLWYGRESPK